LTLEPSHPLTPKVETRLNVKQDTGPDEFAPRYVDLPHRRRTVRAGRRNLLWGAALLFTALFILALAVLIGGSRAVLWPMVSLLTFAVLWVLARLKVFHEQNGVFFALALVALLGASLAVGERAFDRLAGWRLAGTTLFPAGSRPTNGVGEAPASEALPAAEPPLLSEALNLVPPDPAEGSRIKVLQDSQVTIGRKIYRIQAGEIFPFEEARGGEVTFLAGEFRAKLPQNEVQIFGAQRVLQGGSAARSKRTVVEPPPVAADPATTEITHRAQAEAVRRFPPLADKASAENKQYVQTYNELKERHSELLEDPEWPIRLAEVLAQRLGWPDAEATDSADAAQPPASPMPSEALPPPDAPEPPAGR
jgi:hypothetical protein